MSRDDYISKLFIKNQGKLEQAPSSDLWAKLEAELDAAPVAAPSTTPAPKGRTRRLWMPYAVAAAVLLLLMAGGAYGTFWGAGAPLDSDEPIALATEPTFVLEDAEPYVAAPAEVDNPTTARIMEEQEEEEVREQEQRIVEAVKQRLEEAPLPKVADKAKNINIQDLKLADEVNEQPAEWIPPSEVEEEALGGADIVTPSSVASGPGRSIEQADYYQNDQIIKEESIPLNYNRNVVPQLSNSAANVEQVEKVLKEAKRNKKSSDIEPAYAPSNMLETRRQRGGIVAKADRVERIESPMANAHPSLYPFGFLIGKWEDDNELEGKSYEVWSLRDPQTLYGRGYKLSADGTQIFEETFKITYKNGQVFMHVSFEEGQRPVEYMLTSFDQERFIFAQRQHTQHPDQIVLQQNGLDGYSITTSNTHTFLSADQQRYLEHRNRVSNVRSIRTLRSAN